MASPCIVKLRAPRNGFRCLLENSDAFVWERLINVFGASINVFGVDRMFLSVCLRYTIRCWVKRCRHVIKIKNHVTGSHEV